MGALKLLLLIYMITWPSLAGAGTKYIPTTMSTGGGGGEPPATMIQPSQIEYLGASKLPTGTIGSSSFAYNDRGGMTFYPGGDGGNGSLFATGHIFQKQIAEVTIPAPKTFAQCSTSSCLNAATVLQSFSDITDGLSQADPQGQVVVHYIPAQGSQTAGKIWWSGYVQYNVGGCDEPAYPFGWSGTNMASSTAAGRWDMSGVASGYYARSFINVPTAWADDADHTQTAGKYLMVWRTRQAGLCASFGPAAWFISPGTSDTPPADQSSLTGVQGLFYGNTKTSAYQYEPSWGAQYYEGSQVSDTYQGDDDWVGGLWPANVGGTTGLLMVGKKSDGIKTTVAEITALNMQTSYGLGRSAFTVTNKSGTISGTATGATSGFQATVVNVTTNTVTMSLVSEGGTLPLAFTNGETVNTTGGGSFTITTPALFSDCETAQGYHTCPHHIEIVAYNPSDLADFVNGLQTKLVPEWTLNIASHLWGCTTTCQISAVAFDPATNKFYVMQPAGYNDGEPQPIIHHFKVNAP